MTTGSELIELGLNVQNLVESYENIRLKPKHTKKDREQLKELGPLLLEARRKLRAVEEAAGVRTGTPVVSNNEE